MDSKCSLSYFTINVLHINSIGHWRSKINLTFLSSRLRFIYLSILLLISQVIQWWAPYLQLAWRGLHVVTHTTGGSGHSWLGVVVVRPADLSGRLGAKGWCASSGGVLVYFNATTCSLNSFNIIYEWRLFNVYPDSLAIYGIRTHNSVLVDQPKNKELSSTVVTSSVSGMSCCAPSFTYRSSVPSCCSISTWSAASTAASSPDVPARTWH